MENVVRRYAPTEAEGIDFATLEELNAELVGEALVRRYPDMLWTARQADEGVEPGDLARIILKLEQDRSVVGTLVTLSELDRVANETGSQYHRLMAECVAEMLVSSGRITRRQSQEVTTMAQVSTEYQRSLEEWGRKRREQALGDMLCKQVSIRFGSGVAAEVRALIVDMSESGGLVEAASAVVECSTPDELLTRVRRMTSA